VVRPFLWDFQMINTDTRQLRRTDNGHYVSGAGKVPCDHCGFTLDCPIKMAAPIVHACKMFLPAIPFTDETGLRKVANTVRVGVAWTKRLQIGQTVALYNSAKKVIFGYARVVGMESGPIRQMLHDHAHANHLMLDTPPETAADRLHAWQRQQYGPRIIHDETKITAIYLLRVSQPPPAPHPERDEEGRLVEGRAAGDGQDHGDRKWHSLSSGRAEGPGLVERQAQEPA
jgi:hypothetical protein